MRPTLAVLALLAGCATPSASSGPGATAQATVAEAAAPVSPGAGPASNWVELRSEHFTLVTDRRPEKARAYLARMELNRAALLAAAWGGAPAQGGRLKVISFAQMMELTPFSEEVAGFVRYSEGEGQLLVCAGDGVDADVYLRHELAHQVSHHFIRHQPTWFAEGLASMLETIKVPDDADYAEIGEANMKFVSFLRERGHMPVEQVLNTVGSLTNSDVTRFYGTSWLLVHYLYNTRPADFRRYQIALAQGVSAEQAWNSAFADLTPDKLDQELTLYIRYGRYQVLRAPLKAPQVKVLGQRSLSATEERVLLARMHLQTPGSRTESERVKLAKRALGAELDASPRQPAVLQLERMWSKDGALREQARASARAFPDDPRAWQVLERELKGEPAAQDERKQALLKIVSTAGDEPNLLNNAAWGLGELGDATDALPAARHAAELAPEDSYIADTLAVVLAGAGQCAEAVATEERAVGLVAPEETRRRAEFAKRLDDIRQHCHAAGN